MIGARTDFDIQPTRGQYYVIDRGYNDFAHAVLFPTPSSLGKGVLVVPTIHGNYLLGPTSEKVPSDQDKGVTKEGLSYIRKQLERIVDRVPYQGIIRSFSGIRPKLSTHDFVIEEDASHPGFIYLMGIDSPGLASAPAIGRYVADMVLKIRSFKQRPHYFVKPYQSLDLAHQSPEMINRYIQQDSTYGHIVCRCEQISEGEIRDAIRGPLGARSIDGVKRRARPGAGRCQGGFCQPIVLALLAEELRLPKNKIPLDRIGSEILLAETKTTEGESHE
jgi:glycerol-3-phosphate dehydrogenase